MSQALQPTPNSHCGYAAQRGFTVVEFIVILSIFAVMASVTLFNFRDFSDTTSLTNLAFDIALEVKRAQTIGSSSIDDTMGAQSAVTVFFPYDASSNSFNSTFEVYREFELTGSGVLGELEESDGDIVDRVSRLQDASGVSMERCDGNSCSDVNDDVAISFMRPRTEPIILSDGCSGSPHAMSGSTPQCQGVLNILIESDDRSKKIVVEPTGNIYVE